MRRSPASPAISAKMPLRGRDPVAAPPAIQGWHAHIYFDPGTRAKAARLREAVAARFPEVRVGRMHDDPIGPHPMASWLFVFEPGALGEVLPWLLLNRDGCIVFLHPETGNALADHTTHALWFGPAQPLRLEAFKP